MGGIDDETYQGAVNKYKAEKSKHSAGDAGNHPFVCIGLPRCL